MLALKLTVPGEIPQKLHAIGFSLKDVIDLHESVIEPLDYLIPYELKSPPIKP